MSSTKDLFRHFTHNHAPAKLIKATFVMIEQQQS